MYGGDEIRDIKSAKRNHVFSIATSWGYDGHADYIAKQREDILNIVSEG